MPHGVGDELREIRLALASAQLAALAGLDADTRFETGSVNASRRMELAVLRKRIAEEFPVEPDEDDEGEEAETGEAAE